MPRRNAQLRVRAATRVCAAVLLVVTAARPAPATTLVVLVSRRAIVIGADSMRTLAGGGTDAVCKIHARNGIVYGFAGAVSSEHFDATSIAAGELVGRGDLAHKARRIADALQAGLVAHFRTRRIERTRRELVDGQRGRPVTGFIATITDGRPEGFMILVLATPAGDDVTLTTKVDPLDTRGPDRAIFLSAQHPEVIQRANETMNGTDRASIPALVSAARNLVQLDFALEERRPAAERKSGPPASIAVLERGGLHFADLGVCAPARTPKRSPAQR